MFPIRVVPILTVTSLLLTGCGGGTSSTSTSPSPAPSVPTTSACGAIGATAIVNGADCATANSPVVLLNILATDGVQTGACSGTIIAARAILTAAHCLAGDVGTVRIYLG